MSSNKNRKSIRWHDIFPDLQKAIQILEALPPEIQSILGQGITDLLDAQYDAGRSLHSVKELGTQKILGLFKSKRKQRRYDQSPVLHRAINYFYVLSDHQRLTGGKLVLQMLDMMRQYLKRCHDTGNTYDPEELTALVKAYNQQGMSVCEQMLDSLTQQMTTRQTMGQPSKN